LWIKWRVRQERAIFQRRCPEAADLSGKAGSFALEFRLYPFFSRVDRLKKKTLEEAN
jgi:hypothetical protein